MYVERKELIRGDRKVKRRLCGGSVFKRDFK